MAVPPSLRGLDAWLMLEHCSSVAGGSLCAKGWALIVIGLWIVGLAVFVGWWIGTGSRGSDARFRPAGRR